jgi:hypothetical protein
MTVSASIQLIAITQGKFAGEHFACAKLADHLSRSRAVNACEAGGKVSQSQAQHIANPPVGNERGLKIFSVELFNAFEGWKRKHRVTSLMDIADFASIAQQDGVAESAVHP